MHISGNQLQTIDMTKTSRYNRAQMSFFGISYLSKHRPSMIAWWSAAFPGFGHLMLNQYLRGLLLTLAEVSLNSLANINEAMVYSFCGQFDKAIAVLHPDWIFLYMFLYFFAIGDSYRAAAIQNKLVDLAAFEDGRIPRMLLHPIEVQYLALKKPWTGLLYSLLLPGLGQLYIHRIVLAFYGMIWWWIYAGLSHAYGALLDIMLGRWNEAWIQALDPHWMLFMPSVMGGSAYHAYKAVSEQNQLFRTEQRAYLSDRYGQAEIVIFP